MAEGIDQKHPDEPEKVSNRDQVRKARFLAKERRREARRILRERAKKEAREKDTRPLRDKLLPAHVIHAVRNRIAQRDVRAEIED